MDHESDKKLQKIISTDFIGLVLIILQFIRNKRAYIVNIDEKIIAIEGKDGEGDNLYYVVYNIPDDLSERRELFKKNHPVLSNKAFEYILEDQNMHDEIITLYKKRNNIYHKIYRFSIINKRLPNEKDTVDKSGIDGKKCYEYIKEHVLSYMDNKLDKKKADALERIYGWEWQHIHLSRKGVEYMYIFKKLKHGIPLIGDDVRIINDIKHKYDKDALDPYFRTIYEIIKSNI